MASRRPVGLVALAAMVAPLFALAGPASAVAPADSLVFINEIHYDNDGADAGEFVEVAGPAGTDLTGWTVVPYNGSNGAAYSSTTLAGHLPGSVGTGHSFQSVNITGLQNGSPDGLALVDAAEDVVQFLSYEGTFAATDGAAAGLTSTDIVVEEAASTPSGFSLQLSGTGDTYGDFAWQGPAAQTPGAANNGQVFQTSGEPARPIATCPATLTTPVGTAASADVSATDADSTIDDAGITSADVAGITLDGFAPSTADAPASATLSVADTVAAGDYAVDITFTTEDDQSAVCTVAVSVQAPQEPTLISAVQGGGATSPLVGEEVTVEAVVTSLITDDDVLDGFFVQEQDADADSDAATSEGVYIFCRTNCPDALAAGDLASVRGTVDEFNGSTQINASAATAIISVGAAGQPLPTAAVVTLPADTSTRDAATFESVEGMRSTIATTLAVSEYFNLARFGEIVLTADERPYQFTQTNAPSIEGYDAFLTDLATRRIVLDDNSNDQNDATSGPLDNEPYYYPTPGLSTGNSFRGGDTVTGLTGVLEYSFGAWKLRPVADADYSFTSANPRPAAPDEVGGRLKVASFNVLNYFATVDETASTKSGPCGPSGTLDCRGADSEAERVRQLDKIVAALTEIDADVVGLIEIQNDSGESTQQIVDALNAATSPGTYASIDTGFIGTDAIKQAFLYKPAAVTPFGEFETLDSDDDPAFDDTKNRPALVQSFDEVATGERFTVAVNHLKSKGSGCGAGDDSPADGSGNCDGTRTAAAEALVRFLATDPTGSGDPDVLVIGDLNSYAMERPITALKDGGYVDLLARFEGDESYGYLFDGQLGNLDHALANGALNSQVTGAGGWNINADEPSLLDYNDTVRDSGEQAFERVSSALPLYAPDAYRSSDHDPAIVGLSLGGELAPEPTCPPARRGSHGKRDKGDDKHGRSCVDGKPDKDDHKDDKDRKKSKDKKKKDHRHDDDRRSSSHGKQDRHDKKSGHPHRMSGV